MERERKKEIEKEEEKEKGEEKKEKGEGDREEGREGGEKGVRISLVNRSQVVHICYIYIYIYSISTAIIQFPSGHRDLILANTIIILIVDNYRPRHAKILIKSIKAVCHPSP